MLLFTSYDIIYFIFFLKIIFFLINLLLYFLFFYFYIILFLLPFLFICPLLNIVLPFLFFFPIIVLFRPTFGRIFLFRYIWNEISYILLRIVICQLWHTTIISFLMSPHPVVFLFTFNQEYLGYNSLLATKYFIPTFLLGFSLICFFPILENFD